MWYTIIKEIDREREIIKYRILMFSVILIISQINKYKKFNIKGFLSRHAAFTVYLLYPTYSGIIFSSDFFWVCSGLFLIFELLCDILLLDLLLDYLSSS